MKTIFYLITTLLMLSTSNFYSQEKCNQCKKKKNSKTENSKNCDDCITNECCCETKQVCDIVIDFNKRDEICLPTNLKRGDFYRVVFKNLNKNNYNVSINSTNVDILKAIEVPNFSTISLDNLIKLTGAFNYRTNTNTSIDTSIKYEKESNNLNSFMNILKRNKDSITPPSISEKIIRNIEAYKRLTEAIIILKNKIDSSKDKIYLYKNNLTYQPNHENSDNYETLISNLRILREELDDLLTGLINHANDFDEIVASAPTTALSENDKKNITSFQNLHKEALTKVNELRDSLSAEKIDALVTMIIHLTTDQCFYSFPIQFTGDQSELKIELTPKNDKLPFQKEVIGPYKFPMEFPTYWSVGSSFYAGFGLENDRYSVVSTTENDVTTHKIVREDTDNVEMGFSAIVRYGKKLELEGLKNIGFHFLFGPGVSIEKNPRPRFLMGAGLSVGDKHNLTFDIGLIAGYVDQKSNIVDENAIFSVEPTNLTVTRLKTGGFISIGYFFKLN